MKKIIVIMPFRKVAKKILTKKFGIASIVLCLVLGAAGLYVTQQGMHMTNSLEFCVSCHSMTTPYHEYQQSKHYRNQFGVRAVCSDCHVPHEGLALLKAKIVASNDLLQHFLGTIDTPEKFEAKRLELAQRVWDKMEKSDSRECRSCHSFDAMVLDSQSEDAQKQHAKAPQEGQTCISCHHGIVHKKPDMSSLSRNALARLREQMNDTWKTGDAYYPIEIMQLFVAPADDAELAGSILPATRITVLQVKGEWAEVQVNGWRQEEVDSVLYEVRGQRIFAATVKEDGLPLVSEGKTSWTDPDTEYRWTEATLKAWMKRTPMTSDPAGLWDYASNTFISTCSSCHSTYPADHFTANQWPSMIKSMERFAQLPRNENFLVIKYLQLNSSDVGAKGKTH